MKELHSCRPDINSFTFIGRNTHSNTQSMTRQFESFSIEIFLEIFDYLSTTDRFTAFDNLNWKINSALSLSGLAIDLTSISTRTYDQFYQKRIFSNYSRPIRRLKLSNELTIDLLEKFFENYTLRDFKQLRSLTLVKPSYMTLGNIALFIPHLKQLEHVSIDSHSYPYHFFHVLTTSPSIRCCYLPGLEIETELSFQSKIEYLTITVEDITILLNLLAVFPQLKYLNVSFKSTLYLDENGLPELNLISCEHLQILKLQIPETSFIDFNEVEYFFHQTSFHHLRSFSYNCTTSSMHHIDTTRWNEILLRHLSSIHTFYFFVQLPFHSHSYENIEQRLADMQTNLCYSFLFSLSINYLHYIIHTNVYPKKYFDLSLKLNNTEEYANYNPINCDQEMKYANVNSLVLDSHSISTCTILPRTIKHLHIQGSNMHISYRKCLKDCVNQLLSLKMVGLPDDLSPMMNLREFTIQREMFQLNMAGRLAALCPRLELLTIEINCIKEFEEILRQLRAETKLSELKFIRVFSRDTAQTWSTWLDERKQSAIHDTANYEAKNEFLFIWL